MNRLPPLPAAHRILRRLSLLPLLLLGGLLFRPTAATAHGSLENGRMLQVRAAGPNGHAPAPWNDSYYTWNQNSQNFPSYANANFLYSATVPGGTLASAGINDGVQSGLNFTGLNTPSAAWQQTAVAAGASVPLHFLATAPHDPSKFLVYLTKAGVNPDTKTLAWADLELLGSWAAGDATHPVTTSTRANPIGGTILSYDWSVPIPTDRSGHAALLVIWQRIDPAGEAFFSVQDLRVSPAATPTAPQLAVTWAAGGITLNLSGTPGQSYDLQATASLDNPTWTVLSTGTADTTGHWQVSDPNAASYSRRFYRAVVRP